VHCFAWIAFIGIEEKPKRFIAKDDWHGLQFNDMRRLFVKLAYSPCGMCVSSY